MRATFNLPLSFLLLFIISKAKEIIVSFCSGVCAHMHGKERNKGEKENETVIWKNKGGVQIGSLIF